MSKVESLWNTALHAQELNLPYFSDVATGRYQIEVGHQSGTTAFSGSVFPQNVYVLPDSINLASGISGALLPVLLVESSHIMGYASTSDIWEKNAVAGVTDHCVRSANAQQVYTNTTPCQHEIEGIYAAYGIRSSVPDEHKHIVTGLQGLPGSVDTLHVGDTLLAQVTGLKFSRANPSFCNGDYSCIKDPSRAVLVWSVSGSAIAIAGAGNAARTITAMAPGTATVTVGFAFSDTNEVTALFGTSFSPNSFTVNVLAAAPPPPSNITASSVTSNSAVVNWVNGDPAATTVVEYQYAGQGSWDQVTVVAGATSQPLFSLLPSSTYSVRLHHIRGGLSSTLVTASNLFETLVQPLVISVVADHDGALGNVGQNQTCRWQAGSNLTGTTWVWQRSTDGTFWKQFASSQISSRSIGTSVFGLRVIGTAGSQSDTVAFTVTPVTGGPVCGLW